MLGGSSSLSITLENSARAGCGESSCCTAAAAAAAEALNSSLRRPAVGPDPCTQQGAAGCDVLGTRNSMQARPERLAPPDWLQLAQTHCCTCVDAVERQLESVARHAAGRGLLA